MKMNFKYVSMMACAALMAGFTSCSNDDAEVDGLLPNGEMTTARFTLSQEGVATRAASAAPTDAEKKINSATLYVFNSNQKLEKTVVFTTLATPTTDGKATSQVVEVTVGGHYFLAAVNAPAVADIVDGTSTLSEVESKLVNVASMNVITTGANGFFMTNKEGAIRQNLVAGDDPNEITIPVGRAMAKVLVTCTGGDDATSLKGKNGTLTGIKYATANNPKQMYYFPVIDGGIFKAPYYHAEDADAGITPEYFPALAFADTYTTISGLSVAPGADSYLMENANAIAKKGNTSYLLISGKYVPATVVKKDNTADGVLSADGTFYRLYNVNNDQYYDFYIAASNKDEVEIAEFTEDAKAIGDGEGKGHTVNVIEYKEGYCYYAFALENSKNASPVSPFTTKRNVYYDVTLDKVMNAGASVPNINGNAPVTPDDNYVPGTGGGDGGGNNNTDTGKGGNPDPLEGKCEIKGNIQVLNWDVVTQTGGIGY